MSRIFTEEKSEYICEYNIHGIPMVKYENFESACIEIEEVRESLLYFKRIAMLQVEGWTFEAVLMYGEEGVEGWKWESPKGEEFCETGDWNDLAEIPEEVIKIADSIIKSRNVK